MARFYGTVQGKITMLTLNITEPDDGIADGPAYYR